MFIELSLKDLKRIYYVDLLVSKYYNISLYSFCEKYRYDKYFLYILQKVTNRHDYHILNNMSIPIDSPELKDYSSKLEVKYRYSSDKLATFGRIISQCVNWVVEDVIVNLSSSVFVVESKLNTRDLLCPISINPVIKYNGKGDSFYIDICCDYTTFMSKYRRYDLRKVKYDAFLNLLLVEKKRTVLLFIDVVNRAYYRNWFKPQSNMYHNKYLYNTVTFEFSNDVILESMDKLFENCKVCQNNPLLYSDLTVYSSVKKYDLKVTNVESSVESSVEKIVSYIGFEELPSDGWTPWDDEDSPF